MIVKISFENKCVTVTKEIGDVRYGSGGWSSAESRLLYHILQSLKNQGHDLIKKRAGKDGCLVSDDLQYIRSRNQKEGFYIWNDCYQIYDLGERYNRLSIGDNLCLPIEFYGEDEQ